MISTSHFFAEGGPLMYVLLAFSIVALALIGFKAVQFTLLRFRRWSGVPGEVDADALVDHFDPVARVVGHTVRMREKLEGPVLEAEIQRFGNAEVRGVEGGLRGLSIIAHLAPLVGLLGTVLGMIEAFIQIRAAGDAADAAVVSGGISAALYTTAAGLIVAIPALGMAHYFEGLVDDLRSRMSDAVTTILVAGADRGKASEEPHAI